MITLALFLVVCGALAAAPVPSWLKPLDLSSPAAAERVARRVLAKPKMTLQHVEERLAAQGGDGRDAPEGEGIDQGSDQGSEGWSSSALRSTHSITRAATSSPRWRESS